MTQDEYDRWWQDNTDPDGELYPNLPEPIRTLAAHVQALQNRIEKLADPTAVEADPRGWDTQCACAYDHPDAVCAVHARLAAGTEEGFRAPDANGPGYPCEGAEMGVCGGGPTHDEACPSSQGDAAGTEEI